VRWNIENNTSIDFSDNYSGMIKAFKDFKVMFDEEDEALPTVASPESEPEKERSANCGKLDSFFIYIHLNYSFRLSRFRQRRH